MQLSTYQYQSSEVGLSRVHLHLLHKGLLEFNLFVHSVVSFTRRASHLIYNSTYADIF